MRTTLPGPKPSDSSFEWGTLIHPGTVTNTKPGSRVFYEASEAVPITLDGEDLLLVPGESLLLTTEAPA